MLRLATVLIGEDFDREEFSIWSGRWSAHWESQAGDGLTREGPQGVSASEAIAWGCSQADVVLIKPGDSSTYYSAGKIPEEEFPIWPRHKELPRRRDAGRAYLDRPADSQPIAWRVGYSFTLAIADLSQFAQHYRLSLERDEAIEAVTGAAEIEGTAIKGVFTVRASTSAEAREKAAEATTRAREAAWGSLSDPRKDVFWVSLTDDPKPIEDPPPSAA